MDSYSLRIGWRVVPHLRLVDVCLLTGDWSMYVYSHVIGCRTLTRRRLVDICLQIVIDQNPFNKKLVFMHIYLSFTYEPIWLLIDIHVKGG